VAFSTEELLAGFWIDDCHIEPRQNRISRNGNEARLEPRVMDVLVCLAERAGEVVSRDTINDKVWGNVVVTDQAVTNCISELRHHLGDDRANHRVIETIPKRGYQLVALVRLTNEGAARPAMAETPPARPRRLHWTIAATVLIVAAATGIAWFTQRSSPALHSIAVLEFENASGSADLDYLALALSDETASLLTKSRDLAVRPINYVAGEDPLAEARARHVDHIVTGRYYLEEGSRLSLAIEALQVAQDRVVWRTRLTVAAGDLLTLRERLSDGVRQGLLPALGARAGNAPASAPEDGEAYLLYMRSVALPQQPKSTERAIEMLERTVALEPEFAQAWSALGLRYYALGTWFAGGTSARAKALEAHLKAVQLDPEMLVSAQSIVTLHAESGELAGAYREAHRLMDRFGPNPDTHFALSYVYRYGGLLGEAQHHCELALARDPQNPRLRSCGYAYLYAGELTRVMDFFLLDEGSYFTHWATVLYHLRRNDGAAALRSARLAPDEANEPTRRLMEPCLEGATGTALDAAVVEFNRHWQLSDDPETAYAIASMLVFCQRPHDALRFIEKGVDGGYCSFPALDQDPIWTGLREDPDFRRIRSKAMACHERFRRMVGSFDSTNS
jgi:DNA-binding winged helix-turn-helix (wHTH) protein/tetratricopeptide (TPR) repeat protein